MKNYRYFWVAIFLFAAPVTYCMDANEMDEWLAANWKNMLCPGMSRKQRDWTLTRCALMTHEALHHNAAQGDVEWVMKLINDYEFPVDLHNGNYETPLQVAAAAGHFAVIDALMGAGAKPFQKDKQGESVFSKLSQSVQSYILEHYPLSRK